MNRASYHDTHSGVSQDYNTNRQEEEEVECQRAVLQKAGRGACVGVGGDARGANCGRTAQKKVA